MKNKVISIFIVLTITLISVLSVEAIAPTPRVDLDEYQLTVTNKNNVYISGTVSLCVGQLIGVYDSSGKIMYNFAQLNNSNSKESFNLQVPARYLQSGTNTFKVKSTPIKGIINASNPKTITITVKGDSSKKNQTITASDISLYIKDTKNINAKVSSGLPLTYKSNDPNIATVDAKGNVIGRKVGKTTVVISQSGNTEYNSTSKTITIIVKDKPQTTCIINFSPKGGKGSMPPQKVAAGKSVKLNINKFSKEGNIFRGWATSSNGKIVYKNGDKIKINSDIRLYAVWEKIKLRTTSDGYVKKGSGKWNLYATAKSHLNGYRNLQSLASDDTHLYAVYRKGSSNYGIIIKYNLYTQTYNSKSKAIYVGHANDMTYNPVDDCLYITRNENGDLSLTKVKASNLKSMGRVYTKIPKKFSKVRKNVSSYNGIACYNGNLYVRARNGGSIILRLNKYYKAINYYQIRVKNSKCPCCQGMDFSSNNVLTFALSHDHKTNGCYIAKGTLKRKYHTAKFKNLNINGELEGNIHYDNKMYTGVKKDSTHHYLKQF